jgi:hypothetical protein
MIFLCKQSRGPQASPADHRSESRLSIPRRGALQRSSSPLPQPPSILRRAVEQVEKYSSNGKCLTLSLSQLWGAPQTVQVCAFSAHLWASRSLERGVAPAGTGSGAERRVWLADFNIEDTDSLGLKLVSVLSKQLGGKIRVQVLEGTRITVVFPNAKTEQPVQLQ